MALPQTLSFQVSVAEISSRGPDSDGKYTFVYTMHRAGGGNPITFVVTSVQDVSDQYATGQQITMTFEQ